MRDSTILLQVQVKADTRYAGVQWVQDIFI